MEFFGEQAIRIGWMSLLYLPLAATGIVGVGWWEWTGTLPPIEDLAHYAPPEVTVLYDRNQRVLGELFEERRYQLQLAQIPTMVQDAFVAAEDGSFRSHGGIDYSGVLRATLHNVDEGHAAQGASTITQQVVKNLVLHDNAKTFERKIKEAALAWEVESTYGKDRILELYLNSIYLGAQSYGVEAAARSYFGKHADALTLGEAALLAGLPQRPSDYNPYRNLPRALERQRYVLDRMVALAFVTPEAADAARSTPIVLQPSTNAFLDNAPHFTEHVRRLLVAALGEEVVNRGGLRVTTTCDLDLQQAAQEAVHDRVSELDRDSGFRRSSRVTLGADATEPWRIANTVVGPLDPGGVYEALVVRVDSDRAVVAIGAQELLLVAREHPWISPRNRYPSFEEKVASADERTAYYRMIEDQREVWAERQEDGTVDAAATFEPTTEAPGDPLLVPGDLVQVTLADGAPASAPDGRELPRALLHQPRELEGAVLSMALDTGAVRVLVGGADFAESQFNRAIQARRQVGSTFKPFVYGAALESGRYTAATVVSDDPVSIRLGRGRYWTPRNAGHDSLAPMTLAAGLARSRNLVLVRTMIGLDEGMDDDVVYDFARRLGLGGPPSGALPEGWASTPDTQYLCPWTSENVSAWYCRDHQPPFDPGEPPDMRAHRKELPKETDHLCRSCDYSIGLGSASLTLAEMVRAYSTFGTEGKLVEPYYVEEVRDRDGNVLWRAEPKRVQVVSPGVAYVVNFMLREVVERGTGRDAASLGVPVAGKTGTTDEGRDAWFIGMTPELVTGVWVGFDQPQTIGERATGSQIALPIFSRFLKHAIDAGAVARGSSWPEPDPSEVRFFQIDESTGGRLDHGGRRYPFVTGTAPSYRAVATLADPEPPPVP